MDSINADMDEAVTFLEKIVKFWKVVNVGSLYGDIRSKDDWQKVVSSVNDNRRLNSCSSWPLWLMK